MNCKNTWVIFHEKQISQRKEMRMCYKISALPAAFSDIPKHYISVCEYSTRTCTVLHQIFVLYWVSVCAAPGHVLLRCFYLFNPIFWKHCSSGLSVKKCLGASSACCHTLNHRVLTGGADWAEVNPCFYVVKVDQIQKRVWRFTFQPLQLSLLLIRQTLTKGAVQSLVSYYQKGSVRFWF